MDEQKNEKIRTFADMANFDYDPSKYQYQQRLTQRLDEVHNLDFDQSMINEIVLWKVNRYAHLDDELLSELNDSRLKGEEVDVSYTRELLFKLLKVDGIRLAMASSILRFRNPRLYQIFDQRAYRFAFGEEAKQPTYTKSEKYFISQVDLYMDYLERLRAISEQFEIVFETIDRLFYLRDIEMNQNFPIKY